jgi:hypothetical protein
LTLQNNQTTEPVFYWELKVADDIVHVTDKQMTQILDAEARGVKLIKIGEKIINPAFIKSSKKIYKEEPKFASDFLDWATIGEPVVSNEKATQNREKMMGEIKQMLKEKNKDWKPVYKDPVHREAVADVWLHLKSLITTLEFPIKDDSWKSDPSISKHQEGKESHSVEYKTKMIDLGDKYDDKFWAEANYIFCPVCKKEIRKQIVVFNDYESECVVRNL